MNDNARTPTRRPKLNDAITRKRSQPIMGRLKWEHTVTGVNDVVVEGDGQRIVALSDGVDASTNFDTDRAN
jgi:hypothetical protein